MDNLVIRNLLEETTSRCLKRYNYDFDFEVIAPYLKDNVYAIEFFNGTRIVIGEFDMQLHLSHTILDFGEVAFFHELMEDISELDIF